MIVRTSAVSKPAQAAGRFPTVAVTGYGFERKRGAPNRSASPTLSTFTRGVTSAAGRRPRRGLRARTAFVIAPALTQAPVSATTGLPSRASSSSPHGTATRPAASSFASWATVRLSRRSRTSATSASGRSPESASGEGSLVAGGDGSGVTAAGCPPVVGSALRTTASDALGPSEADEPGEPPAKTAAPTRRPTPTTARRVTVMPVIGHRPPGPPRDPEGPVPGRGGGVRPNPVPARWTPRCAPDPGSGRAIGERRGGWRGGIDGIVAHPQGSVAQSPTLYGYVTQPWASAA